ncbi:hypothetical protein IT413_05770 [Candidatus Peregrinibacteria bacterium]|nr:hypothetical protein [Candidatus Peregrinibacteria bacterium]
MNASSQTIPPPATPNWRNDNSTNHKAALLPIGWGESAETHLWYAIGKIKELPRADRFQASHPLPNFIQFEPNTKRIPQR